VRDPQARLIQALVDDLTPTRAVRGTGAWALGWWAISGVGVSVALFGTGSPRPGAFDALVDVPRFAIEIALGLAVSMLLVWAALRRGIPALPQRRPIEALALAGLAIWIALQLLALLSPTLEPSMLGKRPGCEIDVVLFGLPPLVLALWWLRGLAPFERAWAGGLLGLASGALPGLGMQLACMYLPAHGLVHHVAPIALLGAVGAALGAWILRRV